MKKTEILKKNYEFKTVFSKGKYYGGKFLEIFIVKTNQNINKLGIAVSTKTVNSVKRNKIKRLIRENYRMIENQLLTGYNFVIIWRKTVKTEYATFINVQNDIKEIFSKAKIFIEGKNNEEVFN